MSATPAVSDPDAFGVLDWSATTSLRVATNVLAFCDVRTIYLRNVPDEVAARLERLAGRAGMSLNAFTVKELSEASRRADNEAILDGLPNVDIDTSDIIEALDDSRSAR